MKKEKSCGGVLFLKKNDETLFVIEKMNLGHYSLPKGHVEGHETNLETSYREIREETNVVDLKMIPDFEEMITYSPKDGVIKDVYFYLFEVLSIEGMKKQDIEVSEILLLPFKEAYDILTHISDKKILLAANERLKKLAR